MRILEVYRLEDAWLDLVPVQPHVSLHSQEQRDAGQRKTEMDAEGRFKAIQNLGDEKHSR